MRWRPSITFGARLRALRRDYGIRHGRKYNQEDFAELLGIKPSTYSAWEADRNTPPHLAAIAADIEERTGCDRGFLLDLTVDITDGPNPSGGLPNQPLACNADTRAKVIAWPFPAPTVKAA